MSDGLEASRRRARRNVVLTAAIAGLGGLLFGYDTGVIAGALLFIKTDFELGSFAQGLVVAAVPIGAVVGAAIAGPAADTLRPAADDPHRRRCLHRRRTGQRRGAGGRDAGHRPHRDRRRDRARLGRGPGLHLRGGAAGEPRATGQLLPAGGDDRHPLAYLVGLAFDHAEGWRWMLGLGCVPALALAFGMLRMPQSPRWLVMSGDDFAARATLAKIRVDDPDTIDRELEEIKGSLDEKPGAWSELLPAARQSGARRRRRAGDPAAGDRHQHGHLLRADDHRIHRRRLIGGRDPGGGRGGRDQRRHDPRGDAAARPGGTADAADGRRLRDDDLALHPRRRLRRRRRRAHSTR